jgi:hypothetical protein
MKNRLLVGILFVNFMVCTTLAIIINNILIDKCGTFLAWWAGLVVSMLLWSCGFSFLEKKYLEGKLK